VADQHGGLATEHDNHAPESSTSVEQVYLSFDNTQKSNFMQL
jgi:hypothetical protein